MLLYWSKQNIQPNTTMKTTAMFTVTADAPLFTHNGMEYYLVNFHRAEGVESTSHREPKAALDEAGHIPAVIRGTEVLDILKKFVKKEDGWITVYDCRENMNDRVAYFNGLALTDDGFCFYHMDHGGRGEHHALCWRKVA